VENPEVAGPGPILVFARHASIVDNLLPYLLITRPAGVRLHYVLKYELLGDPALDIAGLRLPNHFVRRGSGEGAREIAAVGALAEDLGADEGVLIFPEGTRFREEKRAAAIAAAGRRSPEVKEIAEGYRSVLPPRLGGPLALLAASEADVVILAHRGLDGFATVADIWAGGIIGARVAVRLTRIPRSQIPAGRSEQAVWLHRVWAEVDDWVAGGAGR
jgi:1-acyl-sn-glycerol-3-phosphate acyltransferase